MYKKQKNLLIRLMLVGVSILHYMCPSSIYNLNLDLTTVKFYNVKGSWPVVKNPHYNQE